MTRNTNKLVIIAIVTVIVTAPLGNIHAHVDEDDPNHAHDSNTEVNSTSSDDTVQSLDNILDVTQTSFNTVSDIVETIKNAWEGFINWFANVSDGDLVRFVKDGFRAVAGAFDWIAGFIRDTLIPFTDDLEELE